MDDYEKHKLRNNIERMRGTEYLPGNYSDEFLDQMLKGQKATYTQFILLEDLIMEHMFTI